MIRLHARSPPDEQPNRRGRFRQESPSTPSWNAWPHGARSRAAGAASLNGKRSWVCPMTSIQFFAIQAHLFHELFVRRALVVVVPHELVPVDDEVIAVVVEAFDASAIGRENDIFKIRMVERIDTERDPVAVGRAHG